MSAAAQLLASPRRQCWNQHFSTSFNRHSGTWSWREKLTSRFRTGPDDVRRGEGYASRKHAVQAIEAELTRRAAAS